MFRNCSTCGHVFCNEMCQDCLIDGPTLVNWCPKGCLVISEERIESK